VVLGLSVFITNQQRQFNMLIAGAVKSLASGLGHQSARLTEIEGSLRGVRATVALQERAAAQRSARLEQLAARVERLESTVDPLGPRTGDARRGPRARVEQLEAAEPRWRQDADEWERQSSRVESLARRIDQLERTLWLLETAVAQDQHRLGLPSPELRTRVPMKLAPVATPATEAPDAPGIDALMADLHGRFRGTQEEIGENQRVYLPMLKERPPAGDGIEVLDVGCGRGEWLKLLRENGLRARGLELNPVMVEECRRSGLDVVQADAIAYLTELPQGSVPVITAFHVVEHLTFSDLIRFIDGVVGALPSGGLAILETPNPENLIVGACSFYLDPTHERPLPSALTKLLLEARGLCRVEVVNLHPYPAAFGAGLGELRELLCGPQDYAVIGRKP
jgi:O-antigen chain-terminating methyltransferase